MKYQVHHTIDVNKLSAEATPAYLGKNGIEFEKIIQHYNVVPRKNIKLYEIITKQNTNTLDYSILKSLPNIIRTKVETFIEPENYLYVERHYKLKELTGTLLKDTRLMLAEVVNPTDHKFIVTVRANSVRTLDLAHNALEDLRNLKYTQEYCIIDTNEALDYLHN